MAPGCNTAPEVRGRIRSERWDLKFDDPQHSVDASLEQWVEKGTAPSTIIASKFEGQDRGHGR